MRKFLKKLRRRFWFAGEVLKAFRGNDTAFLLVTYQPETKKLEVIRGNLTERGANDLLTMAAVRGLDDEAKERDRDARPCRDAQSCVSTGRSSQQTAKTGQRKSPKQKFAVWAWNISLN